MRWWKWFRETPKERLRRRLGMWHNRQWLGRSRRQFFRQQILRRGRLWKYRNRMVLARLSMDLEPRHLWRGGLLK